MLRSVSRLSVLLTLSAAALLAAGAPATKAREVHREPSEPRAVVDGL
jgi:hypothetical protein